MSESHLLDRVQSDWRATLTHTASHGGPAVASDWLPSASEAGTAAPLWLEYVVVLGCSAVLFFGGIGLLLAVIGHFSTSLALVLGAIGTVVGTVVGRPRRGTVSTALRRGTTLSALAMCAVAAAIGASNAAFSGYHLEVDNDPGVYEVTGRWLANHSSLVVPAGAPWAPTGLSVNLGSAGMYPHTGDTVQFQFAHLWPVLLAEAYRLGGAGLMFRAPAVLGALGLLTIYVVGCRLVSRPWIVVAAVTALGISLPELAVTRDTFSEPATQVLLWFAIWFLMRAYEERRAWVAMIAGLAVGGTIMAHIDGVVYLGPLPLLAAVAWVSATSSSERRSLGRIFAAVLLGAAPTSLLGTIDVQRRAGQYYDTLQKRVTDLYAVLALAVVVAIVVMIVWPRLRPLRDLVGSRRRKLGTIGAWIVAIGLGLAWSLRPAGPKAFSVANAITSGLQKAENVPIQPGRTYAEQSMRWIEWYIGPVALILAIAGLCLLTARAIARGSARRVVLLVMTGPVTALYLWNPAITPFQTWVTRRYVPAALPLLLLAAGVVLDAAASRCTALVGGSPWSRRILVAGIAGLLAFPLAASVPVREFQPQANNLQLIDQTCRTLGPDAAVLFPPRNQGLVFSQTVRSWCNVPAAALVAPITAAQLRAAVAGLRSEGRTLWVLGGSVQGITAAVPGLAPKLVGFARNARNIQPTLTTPASTYASQSIAIYAARVSS